VTKKIGEGSVRCPNPDISMKSQPSIHFKFGNKGCRSPERVLDGAYKVV